MTNKEYMKTDLFITCCEFAGIAPTKRQASKFQRGIGKAYAARKEVLKQKDKA